MKQNALWMLYNATERNKWRNEESYSVWFKL